MLFNESGGKIWDYNLCNVGKSFNSVFFVKARSGIIIFVMWASLSIAFSSLRQVRESW